MDTGTVSQQVAKKVDVPRARSLLPCVTIRDRLSFSRSADLSAVFSALPSFPFSRKINRAGGRCNGELTSVDSEQKDRTHPMNNGSSVAHYTGEGSRAVLYVKTWTVERPSGRRRTIAFSLRGKSSSSSEKGGTSGICVVLAVFCQARKYLPIRSMLIRIHRCAFVLPVANLCIYEVYWTKAVFL